MTQPEPIPLMSVLYGNRNAKNLPLDSNGKRGWSFGLLSCYGACATCKYLKSRKILTDRVSIGCLACWCPCLVHSRNQKRLDHLNTQGYPDPKRDEIVMGDNLFYGVVEATLNMGWLQVVQVRISNRLFIPLSSLRQIKCSDE